MNDKYRSFSLNELDLSQADVNNIVTSLVNESAKNRTDRRRIIKALGKVQNREHVFNQRQAEESDLLRQKYQKELDERVNHCQLLVDDGLADNWKKLTALVGVTLKRKYNWSNGRISSFIEKSNDLHIEMLKTGEWDSILDILDQECDIQLEVSD